MKDKVVSVEGGFDCIVNGRQFGTWRSYAEARLGMKVEQRRAQAALAQVQSRVFEVLLSNGPANQ